LVSYASDWRYPPSGVDEIRVALEANGAPVRHETLESEFGHGAFVYDVEGVGDLLRRFLAD
ncbi:MAG: homoserine O-acetyltransferase, partial [Thermoanaerobaculia bacterium]|nr:homoserine O-acetyltransferase [Thermoanaerobaculia bacterium]